MILTVHTVIQLVNNREQFAIIRKTSSLT